MREFLDHPAAVRAGEELDLTKLGPFLRSHFPENNGHISVEQFPSGHSNLTYLVRVGDREMVLRRPPFGSKVKSAHDMSREYRVLSKLHAAYAPAPEVLVYCDNDDILGATFYLMEAVRGVILRQDPPPGLPFTPEIARGLSESFIDNLAHLHGLDYSAIGLADLGKPQGYLERQVKGWTERYRGSQTHDYPEVEQISAWMRQHMPAASEAALIHNDYKYDNLVLDPSDITKIVGVLDWEMSTIGDPLSDLGSALAYWVEPSDPADLREMRWCPSTLPGNLTREQLVDRYAQRSGRNVSNMAFYLTFARFKIAVIVQQIYYRYHHGLTKDARFAGMPKLVATLLRAAVQSARSS